MALENYYIKDHWVSLATHKPSPFFTQREIKEDISLIVIHNISLPPDKFGGPYIEQLFLGTLNPEAHPYFQTIAHIKVSAHCLISREGELTQFVAFNHKAWHAGISEYRGRAACNDFSIGIELEGTDEIPYTKSQYQTLIELTKSLIKTYPQLDQTTIVGHQEIAPQRKTDPGQSFDWHRYLSQLDKP